MSINPFDPPALIKTPPRSAPLDVARSKLPPLPEGRALRIPIFDDGERERDIKPAN